LLRIRGAELGGEVKNIIIICVCMYVASLKGGEFVEFETVSVYKEYTKFIYLFNRLAFRYKYKITAHGGESETALANYCGPFNKNKST
jgi:hypothetical protein